MEQLDVLAIAAHPDDVELCCGGTMIRLVQQGHKVGVLDLTKGELASRGTPEIRAVEAEIAAQIMGLSYRGNLGMPDGNVLADQDNRLELIKIIRACRPRLVITHSGIGHPDHWNTKKLVGEAVHHSGLARIETRQPRYRPGQIAFWLEYTEQRPPEVVVDVSDVYEEKDRALLAYRSQLHDPDSDSPQTYLSKPDFLEQIRSFHRHLGNLSGCRYGEGFFLSRLPRVNDLTTV
jgi:bacillithiol biosynthesis deacetylase BshB1